MIAEQIKGQKVVDCYFAFYGHFGLGNYLTGYVMVYENGYKTVHGGGSASSRDLIDLTVLDENNNVLATYSEIQ